MHIWVDADACPVVVKEILFRAAARTGLSMTLVANQPLAIPRGVSTVRFIQVAGGFDVADNEIVRRLSAGDLVITQDIPLAAEVIEKGGLALNPRGEHYTPDSIKARLSMRHFMESLRESGVNTGGPAKLNQADRQAFANALDKILLSRSGSA
ncbi:YaiI/YqxD family protein [Halothiobacillus sp.]|uniref:YaiI/YqxD family protein n=1 Tax=Halothiobacillus sp. TaxID=1891311 RepID=UPI003D0B8EB8